ncbi:hypothetical protein CC86DRAFT_287433 [Ophiobolus disseminans]|uniref:Uncharacterized protein n=1 Tax=Ophiobolus disseminans TaxID=1469910 RepID=A0A6A7A8C4_9PLEO|nr:hypothetical protein CC86DRAFT_287433 [Ophiobolus disseminans]
MLYPDTAEGFPADSSIAGRSINDLFAELAAHKNSMSPLKQGIARFCFYCEAADLHDPDAWPVKQSIICKFCSNAMGPKNAKFHQKARGHQTERCTFHYKHVVRKFPDWLPRVGLSLEDLRKFSRAMATKDFTLLGEVLCGPILGGGPMGNDEIAELMADEEARIVAEHAAYEDGEPGEPEVVWED